LFSAYLIVAVEYSISLLELMDSMINEESKLNMVLYDEDL